LKALIVSSCINREGIIEWQDGYSVKNRAQIITFAKEYEPSLKRILIVDDDPDITLTFKIALEKEDDKLEVYTFNDPLSLLSQFKPSFYDLLLVDTNMPNMNGFELCTEILKVGC
jgi:PleD family two-component response regulator